MGNGPKSHPFYQDTHVLSPFPYEGAADPEINHIAGRIEANEQLQRDLDVARGIANRGHGEYQFTAIGTRIGQTARDIGNLTRLVRHQLYSVKLVSSSKDAEILIRSAMKAYQQAKRVKDPDFVFIMTLYLHEEYKKNILDVRRQRVGDIATELESDSLFIARLERQKRVNDLSNETGLEYEFVEEFLAAYERASAPKFPGVIEPKGVLFIQLTAPLVGIADMLTDVIPGISDIRSIYEAVRGKTAFSNRELTSVERLLRVAVVLIPLVGGTAVRAGGKVAGRLVRGTAIVGKTALQRTFTSAEQLAALAVRSRIRPRVMLRFAGHLAALPPRSIRALHVKVRRALQSHRRIQIDDDEANLLRELEELFRQLDDDLQEFPAAKTTAPEKRSLKAADFSFQNRSQPLVLGRTLGHRFVEPTVHLGQPRLQEAENVAAQLRKKIREHWDAAVTKSRESADQAARRVFKKMKAANPKDPNKWVRRQLFNLWRNRALGRIYRDQALRNQLREQAGIIVARKPKISTKTNKRIGYYYSMHIRTRARKGGRIQTPIDIDHAVIGHSQAVKQALRTDDYRHLISTVSSDNLQLMTARENRNFIEALRKAHLEMIGSSQ